MLGDLNFDDLVNLEDFYILSSHYNSYYSTDVNGDGFLGIVDLILMARALI